MNNPVSKNVGPREPLFGPAAGSFFGQLLMLVFGLALLLVILLLGVYTKEQAQHFLYGDPKSKPTYVAPGSYEWSSDKGLTPSRPNH